ncbi:MAG: hypothetical protein AAB912_00010, partial [Patescibacteria group bacterium]
MLSRRLLYYSIIDAFLILLLVAIRALHPGSIAQAAAFALLMGWLAVLAGARALPNRRPLAQFVVGLTLVGTLMMVLGATVYWLYRLTFLEVFGILLLATLIVTILCRHAPFPPFRYYGRRLVKQLIAHRWLLIPTTAALALAPLLLIHLRQNGTMNSIRTPWLLIDQPLFFAGVGIAGALLWFAAWKQTPVLRPIHLIIYTLVFTAA